MRKMLRCCCCCLSRKRRIAASASREKQGVPSAAHKYLPPSAKAIAQGKKQAAAVVRPRAQRGRVTRNARKLVRNKNRARKNFCIPVSQHKGWMAFWSASPHRRRKEVLARKIQLQRTARRRSSRHASKSREHTPSSFPEEGFLYRDGESGGVPGFTAAAGSSPSLSPSSPSCASRSGVFSLATSSICALRA